MVKTYRTIQHWNQWQTQPLGQIVLASEKAFLSPLLADRYGKHALLIGVPNQSELLECSIMPHQVMLGPLFSRQKPHNCIECSYSSLPLTPGSVDLVIIPHTLDFLDNPRELLQEACRVVKPEGLIIILGFNMPSFWGLKKWWMKSKDMPWLANFMDAHKVKHWLELADFRIIKQDRLLYRPPIETPTYFNKLAGLEWIGKKLGLPWGGVYALTAQAKTIPLTPIKLRWKQTISSLRVPMPGPTNPV